MMVRLKPLMCVLATLLFTTPALGGGGMPEEEVFQEDSEDVQEAAVQETPVSDTQASLETLLGKKPRFRKRLLGERQYVLQINGRGGMGRYTQSVKQAPKGGDAAYIVISELKMAMGPMSLHMSEESWLSADASVLKLRLVEKGSPPPPTPELAETNKSKGPNGWSFTKVDSKGRSWEATHETPAAHWAEVSAIQILLQLADLRRPGVYQLDEVTWSSDRSALNTGTLTLTVGEKQTVTHHDASVEAVEVFLKSSSEKSFFMVSTKGDILWITPKQKAPLRLVACDPEQCERLETPPPLEGPAAAVLVLFECLVGQRDEAELDQVVAWEQMAENKSRSGDPMTAEALKEKLISSMKEASVVDASFIELLPMVMETEIDGDEATVRFPGAAAFAVRLARLDGSWKVVDAPF